MSDETVSRRRAVPRFDSKRTPLRRLESLVREPDLERARRMLHSIREELYRTVSPGPWIAVARKMAAQGAITEDAVYYLVELFLECLTADASENDAEMLRINDELDRVRRAHGLAEDEDWRVDEGPAEWKALNEAWNRRDHEIRVGALRALGHDDIAEVLERDQDEFYRRGASGQVDLWGAGDEER